jgi:transcriptional regulator with XRE-family HTH domain
MRPIERFAANLRTLRTEQSLSQEELARRSGLHPTAISKMERADRAPRFSTVVVLATALRVPAAELFRDIPERAAATEE